jgi:hypothetical protein
VSSSAEVSSCCTFGGYFSKPLIASGARVALASPRFVFSGVPVALGEAEGVSVGVGVSLGSGVGEDFFLRLADGEALGEGEADFFFAEALGAGDSDSFFVVEDFFFLCGVGVGVGVEKIFLIFSPTVSSAADIEAMASDPIITTTSEANREPRTMDLRYHLLSSRANARDISSGR